jgi:hypothetical protein
MHNVELSKVPDLKNLLVRLYIEPGPFKLRVSCHIQSKA